SSMWHNRIAAVSTGSEGDGLLIRRLALFSVGQFLWCRSGDHRIFKDASATTRHMSNLSIDVQFGLLQAATVFEHKVLVFGLDRERRNHALVRLTKEVNPHVKTQRIVFDYRRIHGRR